MSERLCVSCRAWLCADNDAFCGSCGHACADLQLEASSSVLLAGRHPPDVVFTLTNHSLASVKIESLTLPPWLYWVQMPAGTIAPFGTGKYIAKANTRTLTQPADGQASLATNAGGVSIPLLAIDPNPELRVADENIEFWVDNANPTGTVPIQILPKAGSLRILQLDGTDQPWLKVLPLPQPAIISERRPLPVVLEIHSTLMSRPSLVPGSRHTAQVKVQYEGPHGPAIVELPLALTVRTQPALTWREQHSPPARLVAMAHQKLDLTFANLSDTDGGLRNGKLHLAEVKLVPPADMNCDAHLLTQLPADIAGGDSYSCVFDFNLESVPPKMYALELLVASNAPRARNKFSVSVDVSRVPEYDGIIAIDFGTSNTCCALLETEGTERDLEIVAIDDTRTTCPTVVRYLNLDGPVPEIETGAAIKSLAASSAEVAASSVDRLKQKLGEDTFLVPVRPKNTEVWKQREVRAAAADYLRRIREAAEWKKRAHFKRFILTHPAVCSLRQFRNLRMAVKEAFGETVRIDFLQEPVAALVPFFDEMSGAGITGYTVASFDLGGGTTDITLVRVTHARNPSGKLEINPTIVSSWGEQFGGEDLTDFLVRQLTSRCARILDREHPGFQLAERQVRGSSTPDVLRNQAALRDAAEKLKAALSEDPAARGQRFTVVFLRAVCADQENPMRDIAFEAGKLDQEGDESLETAFLNYVRYRIGRLVSRLKQSAAALPPLDHIHLSGKTTFLPVVKEVLKQCFPAVLHRAGEPKECVVRGACMALAMSRPGRSRHLNLSSGSRRTTCSIGILDEDAQRFQAIIPLDRVIPDEGLALPHATPLPGAGPVVLWENLGFEMERTRQDGSRNDQMRKLGIWEPDPRVTAAPGPVTLRLRLSADFELDAELVDADNQVIPLKQRDAEGGVQ
jgi:molecular chaperone DnaK (HSP70)